MLPNPLGILYIIVIHSMLCVSWRYNRQGFSSLPELFHQKYLPSSFKGGHRRCYIPCLYAHHSSRREYGLLRKAHCTFVNTQQTRSSFSLFRLHSSKRTSHVPSRKEHFVSMNQLCDTEGVDEMTPTHSLMSLLPASDLDALIIDHDDPHSTEIPHPAFGGLEFISKFSGSWGRALVTRDTAFLWTDSRYFLQAEKQLKEPWQLMRFGEKDVPNITDVIAKNKCMRVGIDAHTTSKKLLAHYEKTLPEVEFVKLYENPLYKIWKDDRPSLPTNPVYVHPERYTGMPTESKLSKIRAKMADTGADAVVFSLLDEVAYVLNLRGSDCDVSPLFYAFLIVKKDTATLFIDSRKLTEDVKTYLDSCKVTVKEYCALAEYLESITDEHTSKDDGKPFKLWVSPTASVAICNSFLSKSTEDLPRELYEEETPACVMKAVKNDVELQGMIEAHILDGIALARFFAHVEKMRKDGSLFEETELTLGDLSTKYRAEIEGNCGLSFPPISSIGPNGAIVHYRATEENNSKIEKQVYLLDSGGQYPGGTTDVTRTVHFGVPTAEEKVAYTEVLKGHLALRHIMFPEFTSGQTLDVLARQFLWRGGRNFKHATGHGVGAFLNVHEGPHCISPLRKPLIGNVSVVYLEPGMTVSNEPGYYKEGHFGIRIENVVYVKKVEGEFSKDKTEYFTFEDFTMVPHCKELMDTSMLTEEEITWINEYHALIAETLIPRMEQLSPSMYADAIEYLRQAAVPLKK